MSKPGITPHYTSSRTGDIIRIFSCAKRHEILVVTPDHEPTEWPVERIILQNAWRMGKRKDVSVTVFSVR